MKNRISIRFFFLAFNFKMTSETSKTSLGLIGVRCLKKYDKNLLLINCRFVNYHYICTHEKI